MTKPAPDVIGLVEAAYDLDGTDDAWLDRLALCARPLLEDGFGIAAFMYDARNKRRLRCSKPVILGAPERIEHAVDVALRGFPRRLVGPAFRSPLWMTTASELVGLGERFADHPLAKVFAHPHGVQDLVSVRIGTGDGRGLVLASALRSIHSVSSAESRRWGMCTAHIAAGMRLRASVNKDELTEAILEADGRIAHAEGAAGASSAREILREATKTMARARGKLLRLEPDGALEVWQGLVDGRWSLVDRIESDGRRYVVARRNEPYVLDPRALSLRERQVCAFAAQGHPLKLIAYELGLRVSTVAEHLEKAMRKLGARSRAELFQLVNAEGESAGARPERSSS